MSNQEVLARLAKAREDLAKARKEFSEAHRSANKADLIDVRIEAIRARLVERINDYSTDNLREALMYELMNDCKEDADDDVVDEYYEMFGFVSLLGMLGYTVVDIGIACQAMRKSLNDNFYLLVTGESGCDLPETLEDAGFGLYSLSGNEELKDWNVHKVLASKSVDSALRKILNVDAPDLASLVKVSLLKLIDTIEEEAVEHIRVINTTRFVGGKK